MKSKLSKLETQRKQSESTEQRLADLLKVKGVSQQEYDLAVLQTQTLRSEMELTKINIDKTELRAPYDGIIGLRNISPGAYVTPATAVTVLRSATALKLDFSVPEKYSRLLRSGQTVTFKVEGSAADYTVADHRHSCRNSQAADTADRDSRDAVAGVDVGKSESDQLSDELAAIGDRADLRGARQHHLLAQVRFCE